MNAPRPIFVLMQAALLIGLAAQANSAVVPAATDVANLEYVPITPCRIVDTRVTGGPFAAHEIRTFSMLQGATQGGSGCVPVTTANTIPPPALAVNITVDATSLGDLAQSSFISVFADATQPSSTSWMNFYGGEVIANAGPIPVDFWTFAVKAQKPANVIIDVYGYYYPSPITSGKYKSGIRATTAAASEGEGSTALGGQTQALGDFSTVFGSGSIANANTSTAFGMNTLASASTATAFGGGTTASGRVSTAFGAGTIASGDTATAFGENTIASGHLAIAAGSYTNADGELSIALGTDAWTNGFNHSFVYSDGNTWTGDSGHLTTNTMDNQFMVRATNGFIFYTGKDETAGVSLAGGSGSWTALSDRNAKDAVLPINGNEVLDRVVAMPLATWHYKAQDVQYRHMGPMAQDFYAAFGLGESDKGIDTIDADGVALAAIQGLNAKLISERDEKDKEIALLHEELAAQQARVASLESLTGDLAEMKRELAALKGARPSNDTTVAVAP